MSKREPKFVKSIIKRTIKKIEIEKYDSLRFNPKDVDDELEQLASNLNIDLDTLEQTLIANRINLSLGNLYKPETFAESVKDVDAFNAIMVMHEFLRDGKERVTKMFKDMKKEFKGKYFFLGEFDCVDDDEYQKMPYPDRIHFLFYQHVIHPLTWQGLGFKEDWLEIFKNADIEVVKMEDKLNFRLVQFILKF